MSKAEARYQIEVTEEQALTIQSALDLYFRLALLQFGEIADKYSHLVANFQSREPERGSYDIGRWIEDQLRPMLAPKNFTRSTTYGISSPDVPEEFKRAALIHDVIRHRLAWDRNPSGGFGVQYDDPSLCRYSTGPMPGMRRVRVE